MRLPMPVWRRLTAAAEREGRTVAGMAREYIERGLELRDAARAEESTDDDDR